MPKADIPEIPFGPVANPLPDRSGLQCETRMRSLHAAQGRTTGIWCCPAQLMTASR